jgi:hypothetical protein
MINISQMRNYLLKVENVLIIPKSHILRQFDTVTDIVLLLMNSNLDSNNNAASAGGGGGGRWMACVAAGSWAREQRRLTGGQGTEDQCAAST